MSEFCPTFDKKFALDESQLQHGHWGTAMCKQSSYTKNEYNLFYQKLDAEYFLFKNFFEKNSIFWENPEKLFCGHI